MNKKPYWLILMLILVLVFMAGKVSNNLFPTQPVQAQKTPEREATEIRKWEYLIVNDGSVDEANSLGEQGWELVTVVNKPPSVSGRYVGYFKRPKP